MNKVGIMSAMVEEMSFLLDNLINDSIEVLGNREYHSGSLWGNEVVLVFSRWGKVAAASTTSTMITKFGVDEIIFTGVAGSIDDNVNIGDIVVAHSLFQHDFDASPFLDKYEIPLIGKKEIDSDIKIRERLQISSEFFVKNQINNKITNEDLSTYRINKPHVHIGNIASGDQFIKSEEKRQEIKHSLDNVLAVEMEGAAVAQVCHEFDIPLGVIRTISDDANDNATIDFPRFVKEIASIYSYHIIENYLTGSSRG